VAIIECAKERLRARGWTVVNDSPLAVLCVVPPLAESRPIRDIARAVLACGRGWVAAAEFEGREVIRICATHGESTPGDVDELVDALQAAGGR
jgi:hypothetical protein